MEPVKINLATFEYQDRRLAAVLLVLSVSALLLAAGYSAFGFSDNRATIDKYRDRIGRLERSLAEKMKGERGRSDLPDGSEAEQIEARVGRVGRLLLLDGFPWLPLLDSLERQLPDEIALTEITPSGDFRKLALKGRAGNTAAMTRFLKRLDQGGLFTESALSQMTLVSDTTPPALQFEITGTLNLVALLADEPYRRLLGLMEGADKGAR